MANFDKASVILKPIEGGYSTDKNDSGNYLTKADFNARRNFIGTNHGIAAPTLASWYGRNITAEDMKALSYATALKIYKKEYWDEIGGDTLKNQSVANLIFDGAVNQGVGGIKDAIHDEFNVPYSAEYINNYKNEKELFQRIQKARINRYNKSSSYYEGWVDRVKSYIYTASLESKKSFKKLWLPLLGIGVGVAALATIIVLTTMKK